MAYKTDFQSTLLHNAIDLQITDKAKSKTIPGSLALKIGTLLSTGVATVTEPDNGPPHAMSFSSEKEYINFIIRNMLYAIRNKNMHGKVLQRLNSQYKNEGSVNSSIYVYYLTHLFFSLALFINGDIQVAAIQVNVTNLKKLKTLI